MSPCLAMVEETIKKILFKKNCTTREWPTCSLPPLENKKKESTVKGTIKDDIDHDSSCTVDVSTESGFFSGGGTLHDSNKISSNVLSLALANSSLRSLVPETKNEKSQCGTAAVPETERREEASTPRTDFSQQSDEITPLFSTTPEAPRSSHNTPVLGRNNNKAVALHPLWDDEQHVNNSSQSRAYICPLMELRKVFHHLQVFYVLYIVTSAGLNVFLYILCVLIFSLQFAHIKQVLIQFFYKMPAGRPNKYDWPNMEQ